MINSQNPIDMMRQFLLPFVDLSTMPDWLIALLFIVLIIAWRIISGIISATLKIGCTVAMIVLIIWLLSGLIK